MPNQEKRTRQTEKEELNTKDTAEEIETKDSGTAAQEKDSENDAEEKDSGTIVKEGNEEEDTGKDSSDGPDTPSEDAVTSIPEEVELTDSPDVCAKRKKGSRDFTKGTIFGFLAASCIFMAFILFRYGTIGNRNAQGADVLTSQRLENKLRQVRSIIEDTFYYDTDGEELETYLFKGVAAGLEDRYANYFSVKEAEALNEQNSGQYHGIGITLSREDDSRPAVIKEVTEGGPAQKAGVKAGDILLKINGADVAKSTLNDIADLIRGEEDQVNITISRNGREMEFTIGVEEIETAPVTFRMLDDTVGYILIPEFDTVTVQQFEDALKELEKKGMKKLILDLRDNPGGLLDVVSAMLDKLLPEGKIVTTRTKNGEDKVYYSDEDQMYSGPLAILVNGNSASGAELFAGAVQDYGLGPVIGEQTYGKGVVQTTYSLSDGSAFKLTTEKYFTAGGQDIDGKGITPDIKTASEDALEKAEEVLEKGGNYGTAG